MRIRELIILTVLLFSGCFTDTTTVDRTNNKSNGKTNNSTGTTNNNSNGRSNNNSTKTTETSTGTAKITCAGDTDCNGLKCLIDTEDPTKNVCGECLQNDTCTDLSSSKCGNDNLCTSCSADQDCAHFDDTPGCDNGVCRECTKDEHCDGTACDLSTNTCSDQALGEGDQCDPCVSDSVCRLGSHCIVLSYKGATNGQFCLLEKKNAPNETCPNPRYRQIVNRVSVSGHPKADHCGIKEAITTCRATQGVTNTECYLQDNSYTCVADEKGGACYDGGINPATCSYACDNDIQCRGTCKNGACED